MHRMCLGKCLASKHMIYSVQILLAVMKDLLHDDVHSCDVTNDNTDSDVNDNEYDEENDDEIHERILTYAQKKSTQTLLYPQREAHRGFSPLQ